jgi:hypothetical protein
LQLKLVKITFGGDEPIGIENAVTNIDVIVYANAFNEIIVETPLDVLSLIIFDINGKVLKKMRIISK